MRNFMLLFSVITLVVVVAIASEDANETSCSNHSVDINMSELIINDGSGVINNQHTEKPYQPQP